MSWVWTYNEPGSPSFAVYILNKYGTVFTIGIGYYMYHGI